MDDVPATVRRRREIFVELKRELERLSPYPSQVSLDMDEQEMREALEQIERIMEYAEVAMRAATENAPDRDDEPSR